MLCDLELATSLCSRTATLVPAVGGAPRRDSSQRRDRLAARSYLHRLRTYLDLGGARELDTKPPGRLHAARRKRHLPPPGDRQPGSRSARRDTPRCRLQALNAREIVRANSVADRVNAP